MDEFVDRMATQRQVLRIVNKSVTTEEELAGLSQASIVRWAQENGKDPNSEVVLILKKISESLFFLATKSQETVSNDHIKNQTLVKSAVQELEEYVKRR